MEYDSWWSCRVRHLLLVRISSTICGVVISEISGTTAPFARSILEDHIMVANSGYLLKKVLFSSIGGAALFLVTFIHVVCRRHLRDISEIPYIRELIQWERIVTGAFIALLVPLLWNAAVDMSPVTTPMTSVGHGESWNFGWGRPCMHFMLAFVGVFLDYHPAARFSCIFGMAQALVLDTLSSYDLGTMIDCVESGRCALPDGYTIWGLRLLNARDLASVLLATWALLLIGHLSLVIGTCRIRYSFRQLHAGDHNRVGVMRAEISKQSARTQSLDARSCHSDDSRFGL